MKFLSLKVFILATFVFSFTNSSYASDYDACVNKAIESAKEPGKNGFITITNFKAGYMVSTDVKNTFDKNKQRDLLELYYSYSSTFAKPEENSNEELEMVGHSVYFADTCELIMESATSVSKQ